MSGSRYTNPIALAASLVLVSGCATSGPDFAAPQSVSAPAYRHAAQGGMSAQGLTEHWRTIFGDDRFNQLEVQALRADPELKASAYRLVQAQAKPVNVEATLAPTFNLGVSAENIRSSINTPQGLATSGRLKSGNRYTAGASLSYELDIWGRQRRIVEAALAQIRAAEFEQDGVMLLLSTQVANTYWQLRGTEMEFAILQKAFGTRREAKQLVDARFSVGLSNEPDVARADIEMANAEADLYDVERQRNLLEHGLATLIGTSASQPLVNEQARALPAPPTLPAGLPAQLLVQRPDLAGSVALLQSMNAEVGVAEAAFYPSLQLTGNWGCASENLQQLTENGSHQFGVCPLALSLPIFDGGRNRANLALAKARYEEPLVNHQGKLLNALREVEDALSNSEQRQRQATAQAMPKKAAARAYEVALARYEQGLSNYLDVTDAQRSALMADRTAVQLQTQRLLASVAVARAFGGGRHAGRNALATTASSPVAAPR